MLQMGTASGEEKKCPTRIQRVISPGSGSPSVISAQCRYYFKPEEHM